MNPVPIATKAPVQHYPAYSLPTHTTTESLRAAYAAQVDATPRSVSVIGTATNRKYNSDYMCSTAAVAAATHAAAITNTTTTNDHPYTFLVQSNSVKTLKSLCTTSANLPTLLKASLEANLQGMAASGKEYTHHTPHNTVYDRYIQIKNRSRPLYLHTNTIYNGYTIPPFIVHKQNLNIHTVNLLEHWECVIECVCACVWVCCAPNTIPHHRSQWNRHSKIGRQLFVCTHKYLALGKL